MRQAVSARPKIDVVDSQGRAVALGREIGRGGEGAVFEVASSTDTVAKIYHSPLSAERAEKIRVMVPLRNEAVAKLTAWPLDLLRRRTGEPIGVLMPRLDGRKDVHQLYGPKSRQAEFRRADWRFLIRAAANTARAFAAIHDLGCVIGDVNHGGVLVGQDATVRLIDCDSFQVTVGGRRYPCEVGVDTFTPPELQGRSLRGIERTANHDNFGLAVLIFQILLMGRHPFAGRYLGQGVMPIPQAIQECRFAYGAGRAAAMMERPPGAPDLAIVGSEMAALFERAFAKQSIAGGRPAPRDWVRALERLESSLKQCAASHSHWYHQALASCPWCRMEAQTGISLFPIVVQSAPGTLFDLDALWRQVEALPHPGPAPELPPVVGTASAEAAALGRKIAAARVGAFVAGAALLAIGLFVAPEGFGWVCVVAAVAAFFGIMAMAGSRTDVQAFRQAADAAQAKWSAARASWHRIAGPEAFDAKKAELMKLRQEWFNFPSLRQKKLEELRLNQREHQLNRFLDAFEIEKARIPGIGPARKRTLESFGIETAADIVPARLASIQGFGPSTQRKLLDWRDEVARQFRFDPSKGVDPRDIARVEQEVMAARRACEAKLRTGVAELQQIHARIMSTRTHMRPALEQAQRENANAAASYNAVSNLLSGS